MDPVLKQRLIGAGVIWLLAMIFLPLLLGGERESQTTRTELGLPAEVGAPREVREVRLDEPSSEAEEPPGAAESEAQEDTAQQAAPVPGASAENEPGSTPVARAEQTDEADESSATTDGEQTGEAEPPEPVAPEQTGTPASPSGDWFVQVGSFGNPDNARGLRERLEDHGYQVLISEYQAGETPLHRVRVGGFVDREAAEAVLDELQQRMGLNGRVLEAD